MKHPWFHSVPNALSLARLAGAMAMVPMALAGSRTGFLVLLVASLVTDALDGFLARRLNAVTDFGRRLDSWGDYAVYGLGSCGLMVLWPDLVGREAGWIVTALVGCFAIVVYGLVRWHRLLAYHTWASKVAAVLLPVMLIPMLVDWSSLPFRLAVLFQVAAAVEEIVIAMILPGFSGEMPSMWHAWKSRAKAGRPADPRHP